MVTRPWGPENLPGQKKILQKCLGISPSCSTSTNVHTPIIPPPALIMRLISAVFAAATLFAATVLCNDDDWPHPRRTMNTPCTEQLEGHQLCRTCLVFPASIDLLAPHRLALHQTTSPFIFLRANHIFFTQDCIGRTTTRVLQLPASSWSARRASGGKSRGVSSGSHVREGRVNMITADDES